MEVHPEARDANGDLTFRVAGTLRGFRLLKPLPNLRFLIPLPRHMHVAYRPDPNGWCVRRMEDQSELVVLEVPRRYRPIARILYGVDLDALIVADVEVDP